MSLQIITEILNNYLLLDEADKDLVLQLLVDTEDEDLVDIEEEPEVFIVDGTVTDQGSQIHVPFLDPIDIEKRWQEYQRKSRLCNCNTCKSAVGISLL